ncbi:ABC transporter permease [Frondihabitans cladoniiphilus]|uniref:ABC transporter permease n=1 Tax=Frondihabitans cladoniiphilus TaxID=715785 RepID=A0ABP8VTZ7_9MICO
MTDARLRSRLLASDVLRLGLAGLVARPTRAVLSALGIAIGIAAMIAVVGISSSSQAQLAATLDRLGTNLLVAEQGEDFFGEKVPMPYTAEGSAKRVDGVEDAAATGAIDGFGAYRSSAVEKGATGGLALRTTSKGLLPVVGGSLATGSWLTDGQSEFPVVVLGAAAAEHLGITHAGQQILVGTTVHTVVGVLEKVELAPEIDSSVLMGEKAGEKLTGDRVHPSTVYVRADEERLTRIRELIPATVQPASPSDITMQRPSDALAAKQASEQAFTGLLVGLGSVALLVGGIGVANTMVISVLERRKEIGLRRSLGAARPHIRRQFLAEALFLSLLGGLAGVVIGSGVTAAFAVSNGWPVTIPPIVLGGGLGATLVIGALAGLYPAMRAARIPPTEALQS